MARMIPSQPPVPVFAAGAWVSEVAVASSSPCSDNVRVVATERRLQEGRFRCTKCGSTFTRMFNLKREFSDAGMLAYGRAYLAGTDHINAHEGKRPHKCERCRRSFTRKGDMQRHQKTCRATSQTEGGHGRRDSADAARPSGASQTDATAWAGFN